MHFPVSQQPVMQRHEKCVLGPRNLYKFRHYEQDSSRSEPAIHIYFDKTDFGRRELVLVGWAFAHGARLRGVSVPKAWEGFLLQRSLGIQRGDIHEHFGNETGSLQSGIELHFSYPKLPQRFYVDLLFSDGRRVRVAPRMLFTLHLWERWRRNLFHRYLSWAKPIKWRLLGRGRQRNREKSASLQSEAHIDQGSPFTMLLASSAPVDVVLPVFSGVRHLRRLLPKLVADPMIARIVIIDDASPDRETRSYLRRMAAEPAVELVVNKENYGFVKSANIGLCRVTRDCILLNSDVDVPAGWVERLMLPIFQSPLVATTTPFTNAGTLLSFPEPQVDNSVFPELDVDDIDAQFQRLANQLLPGLALPTGVGFCMGISREAIERVGFFDEKAFGRGYGEENDWCQRAIEMGYYHMPVTNLYVHHEHGASFSAEEKKHLLVRNLKKVASRHATYYSQVHDFALRDPLNPYRALAYLFLLASEKTNGTEVVFDHREGGGANMFRDSLVDQIRKSGNLSLLVTPQRDGFSYDIEVTARGHRTTLSLGNKREFMRLLSGLPVVHIHINSIFFHPRPRQLIEALARHLVNHPEIVATAYLHDYHPVCPSHNLLNAGLRYCGVPQDHNVCARCLRNNHHVRSGVREIGKWRDMWASLLVLCDRVRCFSEESRNILLGAFPDPAFVIEVEPHVSPCPSTFKPLKSLWKGNDKPCLGVIGNISEAKGASVVSLLARKTSLKIKVIGKLPTVESSAYPGVDIYGKYRLKDLPGLVRQFGINIVLVPSLWPETYNFVTDEVMALGLPVVGFDIGAHAGRLRNYSKSRLVPLERQSDAEFLEGEILSLFEKCAVPEVSKEKHEVSAYG